MNDKDKNEREIGGLGSNDAPPSPFVSKKNGRRDAGQASPLQLRRASR